jgi:ATP/maltotriose-dependent transcriptional regulator MalT
VGRTLELGLLEAELGRVRAGEPRVVLIEGAAGIGKTALVRRFLGEAGPLQVLEASGDEAETPLPYGLLDQLLIRLPGRDEILSGPMGDPLAVGARVLDVLGSVHEPLVIVVDDAHWADVSSLRALSFALRRLQVEEVLALFVARDEPPPLPDGLRRLAGGERGLHLRLLGLPAHELAELAVALGACSLPRRASERVWEHTGGNPLHARALFEELDREALGWTEGPLPAPRSFGLLVLARLAACSPAAEGLVQAAAVIGRRCRLDLAARLSGESDPAGALEEAVAAGLLELVEAPDGRSVAFPHPLVRAAVYHGLGPARRTALHAQAATCFDGRLCLDHRVAATLVEDTALAAEVAEHARQEAARGASGAAATQLVTAARLTPDEATRQHLLLDALELLLASGDASEATLVADRVVGLADSPRRNCLLGHLALLTGRQREAEHLLAAAWNAHDPALEPRLASLISEQLAYLCRYQLRVSEAIEWAERSIATQDVERPSLALSVLVTAMALAGRATDALRLVESLPQREPTPGWVAGPLGRGMVRLWADELSSAQRDLRTVLLACRLQPTSREAIIGLSFLAQTEYRLGAWDDSLAHGDLAVSLATDSDQMWLSSMAHAAAHWVHAARGNAEAADQHARAAMEVALTLGDAAGVLHAATAGAHSALCRGDPAQAIEALGPALALGVRAQVLEPGAFQWRELHAEALVALGRLDQAQEVLGAVEALAATRGRRSCMARAARLRGTLEAARGDREAAGAAFEAALGYLEGLTMPFEAALAEDAYGRFLRRIGERRQGAAHLQTAREVYVRLDCHPSLERCDRELAACGLRGHRAGIRRLELTPQELAVARLVTGGCTNREVAAELVVSVKTVEYHLGNVFAKLGVTSRSQLVAAFTGQPMAAKTGPLPEGWGFPWGHKDRFYVRSGSRPQTEWSMDFTIRLTATAPGGDLEGTVAVEGSAPMVFSGWLDLLRVLELQVAAAGLPIPDGGGYGV